MGSRVNVRADILPRRLYRASPAAVYLGISATKLRTLNIPRRVIDKIPLYDVRDLDAYVDGLPYEGESEGENSCDAVFG